ncbi:MAG: hypothetical protein LBG88_00210 [Christensenellaceae bacterium]|jgi:exonuclease VII small subunit|nr:hypothetical protein [Christensenellaceae bacterium]
METTLAQIEKLNQQIEKEQDFEKVVELFSKAASLVKEAVSSASKGRGKILEIIRDMDSFIEKELKLESKC